MSAGLPIDGPILLIAIFLTVGVVVVGYSDRLRVPASMLSLGLGMLVGSDGLGLIDLGDFEFVRDVCSIALIVILFEGGLTTKPSAIRENGPKAMSLAIFGTIITAGVTAVAVQLLINPGWSISFMLGAVVSSTDAGVVFDLVRRAPIPRRLAGIIEVESGSNDPMAILLTIGFIEMVGGDVGLGDWIVFGASQLLGGLVVGASVGWIGSRLLRLNLRSEGLYPLFAAGFAGLAYGGATLVSGSGFLAVFVCGLFIGALVPRRRRTIRGFHSSLAAGADITLFLFLGLLVFPSQLGAVAVPALIIVVVLIFVSRPLAVVLSLAPFRMPWREQALISWAGLRGAVPIVLATFPATAGIDAGVTIFNVIFFVVISSTLFQGTMVVPVARKLGLVVDHAPWQSIAEAIPLEAVDVDMIEVTLSEGLPLVGQRLADMPPPPGLQVTMLVRGGRTLLVSGATIFEEDDLIMLTCDLSRADVADATAWARGELHGNQPSKGDDDDTTPEEVVSEV